MTDINFDLLKRICETPGVSSREEPIRALVAAEMRGLVDSVECDVMGNLTGTRNGHRQHPRVMVAAHLDEIGFMVKHVDKRGFLRLKPVGGWDARNMVAQRVLVHGYRGAVLRGALMQASKPIHMLSADDARKPPRVEEMFVDLGMPADRVKAEVEPGDMVTMDRTAERIGDVVVSKTLDNRLSVFVMLEALRLLGSEKTEATILAAATTQEEVGLRGATTAAWALEPDIGIALDVTLANDYPGPADHEHVTELGEGCAVKITDSSLLCHPRLVRHFRDVADENSIKYQLEVLPAGGTDAGAIQRSRAGVPSFTLSVPTRYVHTVNEMANVEDIAGAIQLLAAWLKVAHTREYGYNADFQSS
ncbi:MAG: M42 family metallopeptidase [Armatimonadetes bacterium]|nr:M42 family metallopeptidase [Armatimonadota bacterium]MDE2205104.1 M42 family metallopeptidase [Armatimonadota bacterium]